MKIEDLKDDNTENLISEMLAPLWYLKKKRDSGHLKSLRNSDICKYLLKFENGDSDEDN